MKLVLVNEYAIFCDHSYLESTTVLSDIWSMMV